jgi:hypothetical protein
MSVTAPEASVATTVTPEPKKETPKSVTKKGAFSKDASLSQVVAAVAQKRGIDTTRAGKLVRAHIRANYDGYAKGAKGMPKWASLAKAKENKDGNRYPTMPPSVANAIVTRMGAKVK